MNYKYVFLVLVFVAVIYISGCVIVPAEGFAVSEVEVDIGPPPRPPAVVVERPARPGSAYIWVEGHYVVNSGRWVWVAGRWQHPPRRGTVWVAPRARQRGPRWGYTPGHWR